MRGQILVIVFLITIPILCIFSFVLFYIIDKIKKNTKKTITGMSKNDFILIDSYGKKIDDFNVIEDNKIKGRYNIFMNTEYTQGSISLHISEDDGTHIQCTEQDNPCKLQQAATLDLYYVSNKNIQKK